MVLQMYDDERRVREELHGELADVSRELSDTRLQLDRLRNLRSSSSVSSADINNERRVMNWSVDADVNGNELWVILTGL